MHRYLLFAYSTYYPNGGWNDFKGDFATVEEAYNTWHSDYSDNYENYNIVDSQTGKVVG